MNGALEVQLSMFFIHLQYFDDCGNDDGDSFYIYICIIQMERRCALRIAPVTATIVAEAISDYVQATITMSLLSTSPISFFFVSRS